MIAYVTHYRFNLRTDVISISVDTSTGYRAEYVAQQSGSRRYHINGCPVTQEEFEMAAVSLGFDFKELP